MTKVFMAGFGTEINTFSPIPTDLALFEEVGIFRGDGSLRWHESGGENYIAPILEVWRGLALSSEDELIEGLCTCAQPAGMVVGSVYESLRDELLDGLRANSDIKIVLLCLHGAMVAEGYEDCEGDLLTRVRQLVGPDAVLGVHLDLHVNLTDVMLTQADILISHKEYPHIDGAERAEEIYQLCKRASAGEIDPVIATFDTEMIALYPTTSEPMRSFVDSLSNNEQGSVLSISLGHGFPYSDIASVQARLWVIADQDVDEAQATADELGKQFYKLRHDLLPDFLSVDQALDRLESGTEKPVVIADVADNAGGGAPSDSTFILQKFIDRGVGRAAFGCFFDPKTLIQCVKAGVGATLQVSLGGQHGPVSGAPVDVEVTVRAIENKHEQVSYENLVYPLGQSVWLETKAGIHIVLTSVRSQAYSPDVFTGLGIDLDQLDVIVIKSTQHFYAKFAEFAGEILYVVSPGAMPVDFAAIDYQNRALTYWPRLSDPLGLDE